MTDKELNEKLERILGERPHGMLVPELVRELVKIIEELEAENEGLKMSY